MPEPAPHVERALDFDGEPVVLRLALDFGLGPAGAPLGVFNVTRLAIGRDDQGLYVHAACVVDAAGSIAAMLKRAIN